MSNPIADTLDYFSEGGKSSFVRQDNETPPPQPQPESSQKSKRPTTGDGEFDPKQQWMRVLNRIPKRKSSKQHRRSTIMDDSASDQVYELRHRRSSLPDMYSHPFEDDVLPSATEIDQTAGEEAVQDYFKKPFGDSAPPPPFLPQEELPESSGDAKHRWGKTLDKVRLIANLQKSKPDEVDKEKFAPMGAELPLYFQPLFDPLFIALSKDEKGNSWPPILLPFLHLDITDSELQIQGINQWIFRIELQYGDIKWVIKKRIADFVSLHYTLKFKAKVSDAVPLPPKFPSQLSSWLNSAKETLRDDSSIDIAMSNNDEKYNNALKRRKALTKYLRQLLIRAHAKANYDICEFLEISAVSIVEDMGWKGKEGVLENQINFKVPRFCQTFRPHFWNKQWVILRDSYLAFLPDIASSYVSDVFLFDKGVLIQYRKPGYFGKYHNHITLSNSFRCIEIKGSRREIDEWVESIEKVVVNSPWIKNHRFGSFAPVRYDAKIKWFVDAEDHFNAVAEAILSAKSEIYICDWWLSPELYLRRPPEKNQNFRLDRLLQRKAEDGVKIYIIVYKEMSVALTINSAHTKLWLQGLHENILVVRHPDHRSIDNAVLFWSHHEKIVVVDNKLAFLGGLDLCWGRYDSQAHNITDFPAQGHKYQVFPGQDYSNPRVKDFIGVADFDKTMIDRNITPRMPWHDMNVGMVGPIARDVARHFIQRWNFLKASKSMHRPNLPFLMPKGEFVAARDETAFKGTCRVQLLRSSAEWSSGVDREHSIYNAYMECISKSKHFIYIENQFFISSTSQDKLLRNKIAQAIVERIKLAHDKGQDYKVYILMPLIPAFEGDLASKDAAAARNVMHFQYITISRGGNSIIEKLKELGIDPSKYIGWYSLRNWGKQVPPATTTDNTTGTINAAANATAAATTSAATSPQMDASKPRTRGASLPAVNASKSPKRDSSLPALNAFKSPKMVASPSLADASKSPKKAATPSLPSHLDPEYVEEDGREFYVSELVYIHDKIMIVDDRIVLIGSANINDRSQLGNRDSEIAMLIEDTDFIPSYMNGKEYKAAKFAYTLRMQLWKEHLGMLDFKDWEGLLNGDKPAHYDTVQEHPSSFSTESLSSEETIRNFEDEKPNNVLNHENRSGASTDPSSNQRFDAKVLDPLAEHFYKDIWNSRAQNNTLIYRELFRCVPDDTIHTFEQHRRFLPTHVPHGHVADTDLHGRDIKNRLNQVQGHIVQFPCDYLKDENMLGSLIRETVTPMVIFT